MLSLSNNRFFPVSHFTQPSLPKRLRFNRQHSDLTPKEKNTAAKTLFPQPAAVPSTSPISECNRDREALEAAQVIMQNQTEVLAERDAQLEELRCKLHSASQAVTEHDAALTLRDRRIEELETELRGNNDGVELLRDIAHKSCAKIEQLELEIRQILHNHENEIDILISNKAEVEVACERHGIEKKLLNEEVVVLKKELLHLHDEIRGVKRSLDAEVLQLNDSEANGKRLAAENLQLLAEIEALKRQTDADMMAYVEEHQKMLHNLEELKRHKMAVCADLALKEELIRGLQEELTSRDIDMDDMRDEIRAELAAESSGEAAAVELKQTYEEKIATMCELQMHKIFELENANELKTKKLISQHDEVVRNLRAELEHSADTGEEKIRISEVQTEQRMKALEATVDQAIAKEKKMWLSEIEKCQKIAETEIMQCEFEKQDLKALLDGANELLREKDDRIDELQTLLGNEMTKFVQCRDTFEQQLGEARQECARAMTEKYNYHMTLNNTRSTVNILVERLKKSDVDVEMMRQELDTATEAKLSAEARQVQIGEELQRLQVELEEYRQALAAVRNSSLALQREVAEKGTVFEQLMCSEEQTLGAANRIGQIFNEKIEENIVKYFELYTELKQRYDARENYVLDMKALLDEFTSGIELARLELDSKDAKLMELQDEVKNIKLENMTYKFKCEQFERYDGECPTGGDHPSSSVQNGAADDDGLVSTAVIASIINQLESDAAQTSINMGLYSDEDKITAENNMLKEKLAEKQRQIEQLQGMVKVEGTPVAEKKSTSKQSSRKQIEQLKEENMQLKNVSAEFDWPDLHYLIILCLL